MNSKPICIASAAASFIVACALEGDGLTLWQAIAVLVPAMMLLVWSYMQTDWYNPVERWREMEAMEYLKKREEICNEIIRNLQCCGLNACPLYRYDCGIPGNVEAMKRAIEFVDNYDLEKAPDSAANTEQEQ